MLTDDVERLWPLSSSYEYAAELGLALRNLAPGWWQEFERRQSPARYPLPQAQGYAFLVWLENNDETDFAQLRDLLVMALQSAEPALLAEITAALACRERDYVSLGDPFPPHDLFEQTVDVYAPVACLGYPNNSSLFLDQWTQHALVNASARECASAPASALDLARAHSHFYLQGLFAFAAAGGGALTPETIVTADAERSVCAAAGALIAASQAALAGEHEGVPLCLVRPGSHHAEKSRGGGTCLINNLAVAAACALHGRARAVAIVDLDAHHGNGTENIFREDPRVFTLSIHQHAPFFPGTGASDENGRGRGRGHNLNLPVSPEDDWLGALELGLTHVQRQRPDLILVEYSTDAHRADPASELELSDQDYADAVHMIESLGAPVVYELGASLSERAWVGGVRALIEASAAHR
jgi:acetoin utilization deacetylase AcuC-like enzyme